MPFIQTQFYVSPEVFALLQDGDLKRWGGVIRDTNGQIVDYLDENPIGTGLLGFPNLYLR